MSKYQVSLVAEISQTIVVDADSIDEAIDAALDEVDYPNISNRFEMGGDWELISEKYPETFQLEDAVVEEIK